MPGNSNPNLHYGYGIQGNPAPALNNRNPILGNSDPRVQYGVGTEPRSWAQAGQRVTDVFGPTYAQDPSIRGRLNSPVPAGQKVTDVYGPDYAQDPSIQGQNQAAISSQNPPVNTSRLLQEATRRRDAQILKDQYSQYRSPPTSPYNSAATGVPENYLTSTERAPYVLGAGPDVPAERNGELKVVKDLMDQAVGMQRNPYTETPAALEKLAKVLSGETINGVGAAEVINSMVNRARNPALYNGDQAYNPRQYESLDSSNPKIAARMAADALGSPNVNRALNIATNGLANPNTINKEAINATDFQARNLSQMNGYTGVDIGGNVFGNNYTKPTQMSSLGLDTGDTMLGSMPSSQPTQTASIDPAGGPPPQQQQSSVPGPSLWERYAPQGLQQAVAQVPQQFTEANKKINEYGGGERVQALAKVAQSIMSFLPSGDGAQLRLPRGGADGGGGGIGGGSSQGGGLGGGGSGSDDNSGTVPPVIPPVNPTPPVTPPAAPMWSYPQYTQAWAGLPTGIGGPVWRPTPPSADLFKSTSEKDKKKNRNRGRLGQTV